MSGGEIEIEFDGAPKQSLRLGIRILGELIEVPQASLIALPSIEAIWRLAPRTLAFDAGHFRLDCSHDRFGYLVLQSEHVVEITVITLRPDVASRLPVDQLGADAHFAAALADTSLQHVPDPEIVGHGTDIRRMSFV